MKRILLIISIISINCCFFPIVNADCNDLTSVKEIADKIEIVYDRKDVSVEKNPVTGEEYSIHDIYDVTIKNITKEVYVVVNGNMDDRITYSRTDSNNNFTYTKYGDLTVYSVYSTECDVLLREIELYTPKFNDYSQNEECEGFAGKTLKICTEWIEKEDLNYFESLDDTMFLEEVNKEKSKVSFKIYEFLEGTFLYIVCPIIIVGVVFVVRLIIIKKRREK